MEVIFFIPKPQLAKSTKSGNSMPTGNFRRSDLEFEKKIINLQSLETLKYAGTCEKRKHGKYKLIKQSFPFEKWISTKLPRL